MALVVGCDDASPPGTFDPTGTAAELYGEWDVNGLIPDPDICARAGIDSVEVVFSNADDSESFGSDLFRFSCATGYFDSAGAVLAAGPIGYRWRAIANGATVLESRRYSTVVTAGVEVVLMPVDFLRRIDVSFEASLSFEGDAAFGDCAASFVDTINWELRADTSTGAVIASSNGTVACTSTVSVADFPIGSLPPGSHVLLVSGTALDATTWTAECPVTIWESGPSTATCMVPRSVP